MQQLHLAVTAGIGEKASGRDPYLDSITRVHFANAKDPVFILKIAHKRKATIANSCSRYYVDRLDRASVHVPQRPPNRRRGKHDEIVLTVNRRCLYQIKIWTRVNRKLLQFWWIYVCVSALPRAGDSKSKQMGHSPYV